VLEKHFRFHAQPFAEHTPAERLWPDERLTQGLARLRYLTAGIPWSWRRMVERLWNGWLRRTSTWC
jgi:hypothetical protein